MVNVTAWTNVTGMADFITRPNLVTGGMWGYVIFAVLYVLFFIMFSASSNDEVKGLTGSSAVMFPITLLMALLNYPNALIPVTTGAIPFVLTVVGVLILSVNKERS